MATELPFKDKTILVTGGTGSMGKVFIKRVLSGELGFPKKVIILSRDEAKQHFKKTIFFIPAFFSSLYCYCFFISNKGYGG